jgi:ppGpp synthetase/RelA/SpoT-type nucleotidyltranferase
MADLAGHLVKRLGKRLRDGVATAEDYELLDVYRSEFEPRLMETAHVINQALCGRVTYIMTGRMKRTKSIVRKLSRERNTGMDLSRMADLVGLRVVTRTLQEQDKALALLKASLPLVRDPYDYRQREGGYRAIHVISGTASHRVETQLRTTAQHFWADESERFGEQAKEGILTSQEAEDLNQIFAFSRAADDGREALQAKLPRFDYYDAVFERLNKMFELVTSHPRHGAAGSFVIVYHQPTNSLIRVDEFGPSQRAEAISHFRSMSRSMDDSIYDVIVLNSPSKTALAVTHPRYFPEAGT